jgi:hypothetical protein
VIYFFDVGGVSDNLDFSYWAVSQITHLHGE